MASHSQPLYVPHVAPAEHCAALHATSNQVDDEHAALALKYFGFEIRGSIIIVPQVTVSDQGDAPLTISDENTDD